MVPDRVQEGRKTVVCVHACVHAMKVVERISEYRIRQQTDTDDMQLGFMKGRGITDAIFIVDRCRRILKKEALFRLDRFG